MKKAEEKRIPFVLDRAQRANLSDQIAEGFGRAIASGYYRAGERLPTVRALVRHFAVSSRDVVAAISALAEKGLVESVPRKGLTVRPRLAMPVWKGRVLCVIPSGDFSYGIVSMTGRLRDRLSRAGYLFTQVTTPRDERGRLDLSGLDYSFNQPIDFVVLMSSDVRMISRVKRKGVPFLSAKFEGAGSVPTCRGVYRHDASEVCTVFARRCLSAGVGRVTVVCKGVSDGGWAKESFERAGLAADEIRLRTRRSGEARLEILRQAGYDAVSDGVLMPEEGKIPRQLFFTDDHVATGAMMAFAEKGVRVPEEVRLATVINVGNRPITGFPYDSFVTDPFADGDRLADAVLSILEGRETPFEIDLPQIFAGA